MKTILLKIYTELIKVHDIFKLTKIKLTFFYGKENASEIRKWVLMA